MKPQELFSQLSNDADTSPNGSPLDDGQVTEIVYRNNNEIEVIEVRPGGTLCCEVSWLQAQQKTSGQMRWTHCQF